GSLLPVRPQDVVAERAPKLPGTPGEVNHRGGNRGRGYVTQVRSDRGAPPGGRSGVPGGLEAPDGHTRPKAREDLLRQPYRPLRSAWPRAAPAPGRRTSLPIQGSMRKLNAF